MSSEQIARLIVGLSWLYHGIFPKLLEVAPLEMALTTSLGFSNEISYFIIRVIGVSEIVFGLAFIVYYRVRIVILLSIAGLAGLLLYVAIFQPYLLIGAFNPVTTNIPLIGLCFILLSSLKAQGQRSK